MGRLSQEIEEIIIKFYKDRKGLLISVSEWPDAESASVRTDLFCDDCKRCLASCPVISLGEVTSSLKGFGLFAVGLMEVEKPEECPLMSSYIR